MDYKRGREKKIEKVEIKRKSRTLIRSLKISISIIAAENISLKTFWTDRHTKLIIEQLRYLKVI